ncbi:MAG: hypothetical protein Q8P82_00230 [bacterium]|nr:hypothetical protein [bacterium]
MEKQGIHTLFFIYAPLVLCYTTVMFRGTRNFRTAKYFRWSAFVIGAFLFGVFVFFVTVPAQALDVGINAVNETIQLPSADPRVLIANIIRVALGLLGVVALLIILWGGFQWMMSQGDETKITDAKRTIINGFIGLVIILSAFAITQFILNSILQATFGPPASTVSRFETVRRSGSLGRGIVDMHYPTRGAIDIARNTNIIITFKQSMQIASVIDGYDDADTPADLDDDIVATDLNINTVKIYKTAEGPDESLATTQVRVRFTPDRKTFIFDPVEYLGSPSENVLYTVEFPPDGLRLESGDLAFTGDFSDGYVWQFETGTFIDLTPPLLTDYFPFPPERSSPPFPTETYERNVLIQVNFNEAIDPTSIVNLGNIIVSAGGSVVEGAWNIANGYRSAEFVTTSACGTNSCGETIYCLPANADISVTVHAATLTAATDDGPAAELPYDGITDVAANSLDGNFNTIAEGPEEDSVNFNFGTSSAIDIIGPIIQQISPSILTGNIPQDATITATFNEVMSRTGINTSSITLTPAPNHELWYSLESQNLNTDGDPVDQGEAPVSTRARIHHGLFFRLPIDSNESQGYVPAVLSGVRDAYQNCFVPSYGPGPSAGTTYDPDPYLCNGLPSALPSCGLPGTSGVDFR